MFYIISCYLSAKLQLIASSQHRTKFGWYNNQDKHRALHTSSDDACFARWNGLACTTCSLRGLGHINAWRRDNYGMIPNSGH